MNAIKMIMVVGGLLVSGVGFANAVFPVGNFTIYGSIKTWGRDYFCAKDGVTVMAVNTNGIVLASTKLHDPIEYDGGETPCRNYILNVPLSTTATERAAIEGEQIMLIIISDTSTYRTVGTNTIVATGACAKQIVNVELATDDNHDGVADQYVAELAVNMYAYGYDTFDKDADWDDDGQTNYQEYLAGTDPFDETDKFVLTFFSAHAAVNPTPTGNYTWPITFYAKNGRTYYVVGTGSLETNALGQVGWTNETFMVSGNVKKTFTATEDDPPTGDGTTFYLMPIGDKHFWKVLIQNELQGVAIEKIGEEK